MTITKTEETGTVKKGFAAALADAFTKVLQTRSWESSSSGTDTFDDGMGTAAAAPAGTTIVVEAATEAANKAKSDPIPGVSEFTAAISPLVDVISKLDGRLAKLESAPVGTRVLAKAGLIDVSDNSGAKFPEFAKHLRDVSNLSPGQKLNKATISSGGWSYGLSTVEAGTFIDYIVDQSVLLKLCRTIKMPDKKYFIDKVGLGGKVLVKGTPGTDPGDTVSLSGPTQVSLDASEILAIVSVGDDTLEDNIEGDAFLQHLLGMIARSAANELEEAAIHGDTAVADSGILDRLNGWYKLAKAGGAHVIEAMADTNRFWPGTNAAKATKLLKALPSKYRMDPSKLRVLLNPDVYLDYNDELASKGYSDAWQAITGLKDLPVRGVPHVQVPYLKTNMEFTYSATPYTDGTAVIFTDVRNLLFGIHREIRLEPFRQPRKRCTDYVLSARIAANIENGDAIAIYDHAKVQA